MLKWQSDIHILCASLAVQAQCSCFACHCAKIGGLDLSNKGNGCLEILSAAGASSKYAPKGLASIGTFLFLI